jgi:lipid A ethanolaminephosphotransferase
MLLLSAFVGFFMSEYKILIDPSMIQSVLETDRREVRDLVTLPLVRHVALFGVAPSILVALVPLGTVGWGKDMIYRAGLVTASFATLALAVYVSYQDLSAFTQRHRHVRMLMNPGYPIYALVQNIRGMSPQRRSEKVLAPAAARLPRASRDKATLFVLVIGETARADRFALNGYGRETNPYSSVLDLTSFSDVKSCGTSTAESIPCLFSSLGREEFSRERAQDRENLLELLQRLSVDVRWRENNTGCKGVCAEIETERFDAADGALCTAENGCYDEILVSDLERLVVAPGKDQLLVLHERGSHGPAYQNNTPAWAKRFSPECASGQVTECTAAQIDNAYDNTILYNDWVLAKVIESLQAEAGIYLHGFPYAIAPEEQIHVPMLFWASDGFYESRRISPDCVKEQRDQPLSHDNVFHTIVSVFDVTTDWYRRDLDAFAPCAGAMWAGHAS